MTIYIGFSATLVMLLDVKTFKTRSFSKNLANICLSRPKFSSFSEKNLDLKIDIYNFCKITFEFYVCVLYSVCVCVCVRVRACVKIILVSRARAGLKT